MDAIHLFSLPKVRINLHGCKRCHLIYSSFNKRHPRYFIIKRKTVGAALLDLPTSYQGYLRGKARQALRTNINKATILGYRVTNIHPQDHLDEILAINNSAQLRQGHKMHKSYTDNDLVQKYLSEVTGMIGAVNSQGKLVGYIDPIYCGELIIINRLLGHANTLDHGVMYLMMADIVKRAIEKKQHGGREKWVMYDMMFGASRGLRYFKERLGFKPYLVKWLWQT